MIIGDEPRVVAGEDNKNDTMYLLTFSSKNSEVTEARLPDRGEGMDYDVTGERRDYSARLSER